MLENNKFDFEIDTSGVLEEYRKIIEKSFKVRCIKNKLKGQDDCLEYVITFRPLKPFKADVEFKVLN